jgi:ABC-type nitrate/sulfonate/bicarbonate transport system substrate-binding protein
MKLFPFVLTLMLFGCQPADETNNAKHIDIDADSADNTFTIAVSNTPLSSPIFIAQHLNLFKQHNVNIKLQREDGGVKCFDELVAGNADFATSSETVAAFNSFYRNDFAIMTSFVESDNDVKLLTLSPNKYQNLNNIEGAKIGVIKGSASEFFFDSVLMLYHMQHIKLERVYLSATELLPALLANQVDIVSAWEPYGYELYEQLGQQSKIMSTKGLYNLSFNLIRLKNNPIRDEVKQNILRALDDAIDYMYENPQETQQIISEILNIDKAQLRYLWPDYTFRLSLSNALVSNIQSQIRWAIDRDLVPQDNRIDVRMIIDKRLFESTITQNKGKH